MARLIESPRGPFPVPGHSFLFLRTILRGYEFGRVVFIELVNADREASFGRR